MTIVRREVWSLENEQAWHPILHAYALAVREMRSRPTHDPTSWSYQAAVHATTDRPDEFRNQCQHNSWFFLSWHRAYLQYFELIVRDIVTKLPDGEVDDETREGWALPYWGYDRSAAHRVLPPSFRQPTLRDGVTPNPLRIAQRDPGINAGTTRLTAGDADSTRALAETVFTSPPDGATTAFGGAKTPPNHFSESQLAVPGTLEIVPHGQVHNRVGPFMRSFDTAPLDPIFWLHHANVDNIWTRWGGPDPTDTDWLDQAFDFHDENGTPTTSTAREVRETTSLGYVYDDAGAVSGPLEADMSTSDHEVPDRPAELIGETSEDITLAGDATRAAVAVGTPSGPASAAEDAAPRRVYLTIDDVRGPVAPSITYDVYLHAPDQDPTTEDDFYVGPINFFGVEQTARADTDHGGLRFAFEITDLYQRLRDAGRWGDEMTVSFLPVEAETVPPGERDDVGADQADVAEAATEDQASAPVDVGRVGVYIR